MEQSAATLQAQCRWSQEVLLNIEQTVPGTHALNNAWRACPVTNFAPFAGLSTGGKSRSCLPVGIFMSL